ncbi:hypothetical protein GCM10007036_06790 [Alsobacter metallidurans]|uniref:Localization factor PodJL n=1 Tax=Alsobacter metallidurans TaxID=340221 RepID=A0A917MGR0_9HYPH|nr:hypothetical protein GCM10007036_06790 [Alsobacter metallidurans]
MKGVDANARDTAKDAARRAGMTLGEWLNTVIAETAEQREAREARERDERDAPAQHEPAALPAADDERAAAEKLVSLENQLEALSRRASETAIPRASQRHPEPQRNDLAAVLERAMRETQARTDAVEAKTATALDSMVRFMERADSQRRDELGTLAQAQERTSIALRDALALVTGRMDSLEHSISRRDGAELQPIKAAIQRLEMRLDERMPAPREGASRIESKMKDLEARLVDIADKLAETEQSEHRDAPRVRSDRIARIEEKLAAVLNVLDGQHGRAAYDDEADDVLDEAPAQTMDEAISQIRSRQQKLEGARERRSANQDRTAELLDGLRGDVISLAQRLERIDEPRDIPGVDAMRRELADLARSVHTTANRSDFAALERSIGELSERIDAWQGSGPSGTGVTAAERVIDDMRALIDELRPVAGLTTLRDDISALATRLDRAPQHGLSAETAEAILSQIMDLRASVGKAARPVSLEPLERQVAALNERLEAALAAKPGRGGDKAGLGAIAAAVAELRAAAREFQPNERFSRLERQIGDLGQRLDANAAEPDRSAFDDIRSRLDRVQSAVENQTAPDLSPLESLIGTLTNKLATVQAGASDRPSLDGLSDQLARMTAALERSGEGFSALRSMERSIGDLFAKIEDAKLGAIQAADIAAQRAAEQATQRFAAGEPARPASEFAEVRTRQTLEAVHDTLEKIVERLGMLESDMASDRVRLLNVAEKAQAAAPAEAAPTAAPASPSLTAHSPSLTAQKMAAAAAAAEAARALGPQVRAPAPKAPTRSPEAERPAPAAAQAPVLDLGGDLPLEPGSGRPTYGAEPSEPAASRSASQDSPQASFIAAARKAAQAAQATQSAEPSKPLFRLGRGSGGAPAVKESKRTKNAGLDGEATATGSAVDQVRAYVDAKRRPILIGLAAIVLALSSAQVARHLLSADSFEGTPPQIDAPQSAPAKPSKASEAPAAPKPDKEASAITAPSVAPAQKFSLNNQPIAPGPSGFGPTDPSTVGSLGSAPSAAPSAAPPPVGPDLGVAADLPAGQWPKPLQKAVGQNDPAATFEVATRLADGRGVARDPKLAAKWFEKAASLGLAPAQYRLGSILEKGVGVPRDLAAAKTWYQRAAEAGNAKAMHNLGVVIADGAGGKPDYAGAATWFRKAAEYGVRDSQYNLAILTARGLGVQPNLAESWVWFSLAAAQGDQDAAKKRDEVAARLDAEAASQAKAALQAFKPKPTDPRANEVAPPPGGWDQEPVGLQGLPKGKSARL